MLRATLALSPSLTKVQEVISTGQRMREEARPWRRLCLSFFASPLILAHGFSVLWSVPVFALLSLYLVHLWESVNLVMTVSLKNNIIRTVFFQVVSELEETNIKYMIKASINSLRQLVFACKLCLRL